VTVNVAALIEAAKIKIKSGSSFFILFLSLSEPFTSTVIKGDHGRTRGISWSLKEQQGGKNV
jgi:hypothetical protein